MSIINIRLEFYRVFDFYKIKLNDQLIIDDTTKYCVEFTTPILKDHKMHCLDLQGKVTVEKLILDGIDTDYFIHHGFCSDGNRGNHDNKQVRYYFQTPIWEWYIDWKQHDNSKYRNISKDHSGFIPL
tara:strand:+ start:3153 stop:3533 length:381 start_codon:yes stop_codon:yes gene_type:complete